MKYRVTHITSYIYDHPVDLCQSEARLYARDFEHQQCLQSHLEIEPEPMDLNERIDFFGNRVSYFAIQQPHEQLKVSAVSEVNVLPRQIKTSECNQISWEQVQLMLSDFRKIKHLEQEAKNFWVAKPYSLESPMIMIEDGVFEYARHSFLPGRPLIEVVLDITQRIFNDFIYDSGFTTVATPLSDVLEHRRGVCQDFSHLAIACLRAFGLPARYVSGYIETLPAAGEERLVGADASHAWFSVNIPETGWVDFDPTNNQLPNEQHITLAWGRDYSDVTPLKGIAIGGGEQSLEVSVDVLRLE